MSEPKRRFFSGDTLQQALVQAASYYNLEPHQVAYRALEKRHGFLKVRRKVVIEVDPEAPRRETSAPARVSPPSPAPPPPAPVRPEPPAVRPEAPPVRPEPPLARPEPEAPPVRPAAPPLFHPDRPERADWAARPARPEGERDSRRERQGSHPERRPDRPERAAGDRPPRERGRFDRDRPAGARADRPVFADRAERGGPPRERGPRERWEPRPQPAGAFSPPAGPPPAPRRDWDEEPPRARIQDSGSLVALPETPRRPSERYLPARGPQAEAAARGMELLLRIAGLRLEARILQGEEERLEIDLSGEDTDWCFSDDGEFLGAVEHLLPRIIRSLSGEAVLCRVDCDNFHEIREERLRSLAQQMASEVQRLGRARTLEPMNPSDRRVVHMTLEDDPHVVTESEGEGYFKRITIRPA
jgi:spoIIIJ-associated protein